MLLSSSPVKAAEDGYVSGRQLLGGLAVAALDGFEFAASVNALECVVLRQPLSEVAHKDFGFCKFVFPSTKSTSTGDSTVKLPSV